LSDNVRWWPEPTAGTIVWCRFPEDLDLEPNPGSKPRPALVVIVYDDDEPQFHVLVAYGTSQRTTSLHRGEFAILRTRNSEAYELAGLSYDTRFDLKKALELPYNTEYFGVPPAASHGQTPKLGSLHASLMPAFRAAWTAARQK
jgi:hypothetical protein